MISSSINAGRTMASPPQEYKALHPMGIAPVVTDGDLVLGESAAICEYIAVKHGDGRLIPSPDSPDYAGHLFWFHFFQRHFHGQQHDGSGLPARRGGTGGLRHGS
ncbi:glutathione S-transferase family protein [Novosphingobium colocasiae]